jgi:hypothetical protein
MKTPVIKVLRTIKREEADYCGLLVRVLLRMEHCSLIQYGNRQFIVDTDDLSCERAMKCVA